MADLTVTASAVRAVAHDPEDVQDFDCASGYTPAFGDLVRGTTNDNEVDKEDANDPALNKVIWGLVIAWRRTGQGTAGYRVTVLQRGLVEGFTGLTPGRSVYNSTTAGKLSDTDPTGVGAVGRTVGYTKNSTQLFIACPVGVEPGES